MYTTFHDVNQSVMTVQLRLASRVPQRASAYAIAYRTDAEGI